jgi:hypothetical protein
MLEVVTATVIVTTAVTVTAAMTVTATATMNITSRDQSRISSSERGLFNSIMYVVDIIIWSSKTAHRFIEREVTVAMILFSARAC